MNITWKDAVAAHDHSLILALLSAGLRLDEARDVAQEAWLKVMEASAEGRLSRIELPGLVIRQASFIVSDRQRARRVRNAQPLHQAEALAAPDDAESGLHTRELLKTVGVELASASPRAQSVFWAAFHAPELGHGALAQVEGLSVQRFRQVLCEVRAKLRRAVERP